ncbi:MAG: GGDEF domain-containing protein [Oscillospiraceae bacterium]|nr:GGDEF domain-containing protein [Oscillospiraceae bacterium]
MQKLLHLGKNEEVFRMLREITPNVISAGTTQEAMKLLKGSYDFTSVLIEFPSAQQDISKLLYYIEKTNSYVFSAAVLLLSDTAHIDADCEYLGGVAVDVLMLPSIVGVMANRIRNAENLIGSVSFNEFAEMLKALPANIFLKDETGRYVFSSQTWHHLNTDGDPDWTIRGKTDLEIRKDKENAKLAMLADMEIIRSGKGTSYIIEENDGKQEFLQLIKEPLFYPDGRVKGIIALINDVTEQELMRRALHERSIHDQLTGLYNRSYLDEYISGLKDQKAYPVSIISADCDNLKIINDTYGHMIGDEYIRMCVSVMRAALPEESSIFRMGGDEFIAFVPGTSSEQAEQFIANAKQNAGSYRIRDNTLSISMGFATAEDANSSIVDCIKRSDVDMYQDKLRHKRAQGDPSPR